MRLGKSVLCSSSTAVILCPLYASKSDNLTFSYQVSLAAMRGQDTKALYADLKKAGATAAQQAKFDKSISALDFKPIAAKLGTVKELRNGAHPSSKLKAEGAPTGKNIMLWVEMEGTKNHVVWGKLDASGKGQYWDHQGHSNADTANKLVNEGNVYYAMWYE